MTKPSTLAAQLAALPQLPQDRLWAMWDKHFPRRPSRVNRRYLEARLAYRLQENASVDYRPMSGRIWPTVANGIPRSRSGVARRFG